MVITSPLSAIRAVPPRVPVAGAELCAGAAAAAGLVASTAAGLLVSAGFAGAGLYNHSSTGFPGNTGTISDKQNVHYANMPNVLATPEGNVDFVHAAEMSVHAVVHVKTYYENKNTLILLYSYLQN